MQIDNINSNYSAEQFKRDSEYAVALALKNKQVAEQRGVAALNLIDSAREISKISGAEGANGNITGNIIDIIA